ncbi:hypothetical protein DLJ61_23025 [Gordonia terrae]|uniref:Uncharacterized protein n=1 Tax=Gordonia terrae TaxID=2055 RepID=A0AAD0KCQ7_9ACTN|nr:hypothetical protein DLJ61_23025 [Gordonia terrae]
MFQDYYFVALVDRNWFRSRVTRICAAEVQGLTDAGMEYCSFGMVPVITLHCAYDADKRASALDQISHRLRTVMRFHRHIVTGHAIRFNCVSPHFGKHLRVLVLAPRGGPQYPVSDRVVMRPSHPTRVSESRFSLDALIRA